MKWMLWLVAVVVAWGQRVRLAVKEYFAQKWEEALWAHVYWRDWGFMLYMLTHLITLFVGLLGAFCSIEYHDEIGTIEKHLIMMAWQMPTLAIWLTPALTRFICLRAIYRRWWRVTRVDFDPSRYLLSIAKRAETLHFMVGRVEPKDKDNFRAICEIAAMLRLELPYGNKIGDYAKHAVEIRAEYARRQK